MADFEKKVSIIEIEIDNKAATAEVDKLTTAILDQKKQISDNTKAIKDYEAANKAAAKALNEGTISLEDYNEVTDKNTKAVQSLQKQNLSLNDGLKTLNTERSNAVKVSQLQSNSLDALRNQTARYQKELNGLNTKTKEGAERFAFLTAKLKENNDKIVGLDQASGSFKTTIGRYTDGIKGAVGELGLFSGVTQKVAQAQSMASSAVKAFSVAQVGSSAATGGVSAALKIMRVALISTGIGAIVVLLGSLVAWFLKTDEGATKLNGIFRAIGNTVDVFLNRIINLKQTITDLFSSPGKFFSGLVSDVKEAVKTGQELADTFDDLDQKRRDSELLDKQQSNRLNQLILQSKNLALSIQERLKILEEVDKIELANYQNKLKYAEEFLAAVNKETAQMEKSGTITDEQLDKQNEARIALLEVQNESISVQEKIENRRSALLEKQSAEEEKAREARKKIAEKEASDKEKQLEKETEDRKKAEEKAIEDQKEADAKRLENQEILTSKLLALEEFRRSKANETALASIKDKEALFKKQEEIEAANFEIVKARIEEENAAIQESTTATNEEKLIAKADFDLQMLELESSYSANLKGIEEARNAESLRLEKERQDNTKAIARAGQEAIQSGFQISNNLIEGYYQKRTAEITKQLESGQITEEQFARKKAALDKSKAKDLHKAQVAEFRVSQLIAVAQIGVDTAKAIMASVAATPLTGGLPFSAISAGLGVAQAAVVLTKKPPPPPSFELGGDVFGFKIGGKDHSQGGTEFTGSDGSRFVAQKDEGLFVTKREATNPVLRMLSEQNVKAGGRSMFGGQTSRYLENGGQAAMGGNQDLSILAEAIENMPPPVVKLESIMAGIGEVQKSRAVGIV